MLRLKSIIMSRTVFLTLIQPIFFDLKMLSAYRVCCIYSISWQITTRKHVLSGHSKIDKTKVLKTNGHFLKVESISECSLGAFCNTFDLH